MIPYNILFLAMKQVMGTYTFVDDVLGEIRRNFPLYTEKQRDNLLMEISYHVVTARESGRFSPQLDKWVELMIELTPGEDRI